MADARVPIAGVDPLPLDDMLSFEVFLEDPMPAPISAMVGMHLAMPDTTGQYGGTLVYEVDLGYPAVPALTALSSLHLTGDGPLSGGPSAVDRFVADVEATPAFALLAAATPPVVEPNHGPV